MSLNTARATLRAALASLALPPIALAFACGDAEEQLPPLTVAPTLSPSPATPAASQSAPTQIPGWKTLHNTRFGYSIQYPAEWIIHPGNAAEAATSDFASIWNRTPPPSTGETAGDPGVLQIQIIVFANPGERALDDWLREHDSDSPLPPTVLATSKAVVNGNVATVRLEKFIGEGSGEPFNVYYFSHNAMVVGVSGPAPGSPTAGEAERVIGTLHFD